MIYSYFWHSQFVAADGGGGGGQRDVNIPSSSRSKAVANDYRHSTGVDFEPNEHVSNGVTAGQARHNSSNVGVSRARWDTTLVYIIQSLHAGALPLTPPQARH